MKDTTLKNPTKNPINWVATTYFAMGLPLIFISQVLVIEYKDLGLSNADITKWTSLLIIPWSLKPLFSVVMEMYLSKRLYQISTEVISALMFGLIAFSLHLDHFFAITLSLAGVMAISGSIHDIAGDGIYLEKLHTKEQSSLAGWQGAFYNLAKVLCNGALVYLAGYLTNHIGTLNAWVTIMVVMGVIMAIVAIYHTFVLPKSQLTQKQGTLEDKLYEVWNLVIDFCKKKHIIIYIVFILFYRFSEGLAMKVAPLFLKDGLTKGGLGLSNEEYGLIYGIFGTIAFITGSILAGKLVSRIGLRKSLFALVLTFNIPFAIYLLFAVYQPITQIITINFMDNIFQVKWVIALGIVFEYFSYGFGFVGLMLFMMQQVAPGKYKMAHYAFANSIMNLSVMIPGMISGKIQESVGYTYFFIIVLLVSIPAIILSKIIPWAYNDK